MKRFPVSALLVLPACGAVTVPASDLAPTKPAVHEAASAAPAAASAPAVAATAPETPNAAEPTTADLPAPPDVAAPPADAARTASGLATRVLAPGTGKDHPGPEDLVEVHYSGWTVSGRMFDSSVVRKKPIKIGVNHVIAGWTEGLQLMVVGEKRRFWIPADLAFGRPPGVYGAPEGAVTFDVELLSVAPAPRPPPVPKDVKKPPATAKKTRSGLAYRVLKKGPGKGPLPTVWTNLAVEYTGWTTDGKMFDSSITRGEPFRFKLDQVMKGWAEGIQLMMEGDSFRFWIPAPLAYGVSPKQPGVPAGMLVFDIELLGVDE